MLGTLRQFAPASLFLPSPLLRFPPETLLCLCRGEHREPHADLARHGLEPLDLGVAEVATRRRASSKHIDLLELERELTRRVVVPFGKSRSVEEHRIPSIAPCRQVTLALPRLLLGTLGIGQHMLLALDQLGDRKTDDFGLRFEVS
jgi:hypothetical protein